MCKGEQIPDQRRPPLCSAQSGVQQTSHAGVDNGARLSHFEIADNRCEQVVKVVRDTTGQLAEGFHFLCLPQSILGSLSLLHFGRQLCVCLNQLLGPLSQVDV